jgi:hypothetical protein
MQRILFFFPTPPALKAILVDTLAVGCAARLGPPKLSNWDWRFPQKPRTAPVSLPRAALYQKRFLRPTFPLARTGSKECCRELAAHVLVLGGGRRHGPLRRLPTSCAAVGIAPSPVAVG